MQENSKLCNRIPLLALVPNRTRQNDDGTSLKKQTSNDNFLQKVTYVMFWNYELWHMVNKEVFFTDIFL